MNAKGITLIEMMVAIAIAAVVTTGAFMFFNNTYSFTVVHGQTAEMQREGRIAMDIIGREIRATGFGIREPLTGTIQGATEVIQPGNNADPDPVGVANKLDRITLLGGYQRVGTLTAAATAGATAFAVALLPGVAAATLDNKTITVGGFYLGTVTARTGATNPVITVSPALNRDFSTRNSVFIIQTIRYRVGIPAGETEPVLFREIDLDNNGTFDQTAVIASGIEDLQFAYLLSNGNEPDSPAAVTPPAVPLIRAVRVSILSRRLHPSATALISTRPAVEDHAAAGAADRYHRRLLTKVVQVRNLGF